MSDAVRKRLVLSANSAWNLFNFRGGLIRSLIAEGYHVTALAPTDQASSRLAEIGCKHVPLAMDNKGTSPHRDLALLFRFVQTLRRERPDAFLGFTIKPNVYGSLAARLLGISTINTITGLGTAFIREDWLTLIVKRLYKASLADAHTVFFQNDDDRKLFADDRLVEEKRTALLPGSGVDLSHFSSNSNGARDGSGGFCFLFCGRLLWDKGVGELVEAARMVCREVPDARFQLLGYLEADNLSAIPSGRVQSWVAEGLVEYLGAVEDVRPALAAADCVVLPSYREGAPRALLEAAAMARPLIAADVPGCREVVEHGRNGFLCRARNAQDLSRWMLEMTRLTQEDRDAMGAAGRRMVEEKFDERLVIQKYLDVLGELVKR